MNTDPCVIDLPRRWVNIAGFERALGRASKPLGAPTAGVQINIPAGCMLMIDVTLQVLSLCNQIAASGRPLVLAFAGGEPDMGYLSRMAFFDQLARTVEVQPARPTWSGAEIHRGGNGGLVEIEPIRTGNFPEQALVQRLSEVATRSCGARTDALDIGGSIFTIFGELIGNIFDHSQTQIDGFAASQTYPRGNCVCLAVSDSGIGIMNSLRPALEARGSHLIGLNDVALLVEVFRQGISRIDDHKHGLGLRQSAAAAIKFQADLDIRLPRQRVLLKPADGRYHAENTAYTQDALPLLNGTHISFTLRLS